MRALLAALLSAAFLAGAAGLAVTFLGGTSADGEPQVERSVERTTQPSTAESTPQPIPVRIDDIVCPTAERQNSIYDFFSRTGGDPKETIAQRYRDVGVEAVVQGQEVFLLRDDGTPFSRLRLDRIDDGWRLSGDESCAGESMLGSHYVDLDCGAGLRNGVVTNPEVHPAGVTPEAVVQPWLLPEAFPRFTLEIDDEHASAELVTQKGDAYAVLGLARIDRYWRVRTVDACTSDFPGLGAAEVFGSGRPLVSLVAVAEGHCWVDTLAYDGRRWDLRDRDQFGTGGLGPDGFLAVGSVEKSSDGTRLDYVDLSGAQLELVPADTPGTEANDSMCD